WSKSELIDIMNNDVHTIHHLGHANVNYDMKLYNADVDALTNDKYFFAYSQGCLPGSFDNWYSGYKSYDSIGEHFVTTEHGAFSVIMNSRFGWGRYSSTDGPSQRYHREFFDAVFEEDLTEFGKANQDSKEDNIGSIADGVMRWCYYELTLLGDPETKFKTDFSSPQAEITSPVLLTETAGIINITGYAKEGTKIGSTFKNYTVSYGVGINPTQWYTDGITLMNGGNSAVDNGTIAQWHTGILNGMYTIRLTVNDTNNEQTVDYTVVYLFNKPQVITINSPQNKSYDSPEILFEVSVNTDADTQECTFSIDGQENIHMDRNYYDYNIIYTDISKGQHNVVFSCTDKYGVVNATQPLWFSVSPETISGCSVLDMQDTTYYLISDIIDSSENTCINITAENVTIDCQNHIVDG
ncbi:MAG: hypothetical protein KAQ92_04710, partial [Candidatus Aenigmarchaeota archaeon]|nr:hypothetical protein [Candidatus Aenigmarchaeota archaeon]